MKKGISPVIAAVLLVIIAVAAGVLIWAWVSGFAQKNPAEEPALRERIKIDSVIVNDTSNITVIVSNIGETTVNISALYILDTNGNVVYSNTSAAAMAQQAEKANLSDGTPDIAPGRVEGFTAQPSSWPLQSGQIYIVKVVTSRGIEATYTFRT